MDARVKALMMLIALSVVPTQSFSDGIFSPPKIAKWEEKIAISERSDTTTSRLPIPVPGPCAHCYLSQGATDGPCKVSESRTNVCINQRQTLYCSTSEFRHIKCHVRKADRRDVLQSGQQMISENGEYVFKVQADGNLVLYKGSDVLWASGTHGDGNAPYSLKFQTDNHLVLYDASSNVTWAPDVYVGKDGHHWKEGGYAVLQDDGNFVVYDGDNKAMWATDTHGGQKGSTDGGIWKDDYFYLVGKSCKGSGYFEGMVSSFGTFQAAKAACSNNNECGCIWDRQCDGDIWSISKGHDVGPHAGSCAWTVA